MSLEQVKARHRLAWGLDVESYVRHTASEIGPVAERLIEVADPAWNAAVIDLGCGPGTASFPAARRVGPGGRVVGIDLAPAMVAWAERSATAQGLTQALFAVGDAEDLSEVPDGEFDVAISNFGVIFAPDATRMVGEAARVLKPGGAFAMSVWVPVGIVAQTFAVLSSVTPPPPEGASTPESWGEPGMAEARLSQHFDGITRVEVPVPCEYPSVDIAWQRMRDGRPPFALAYGRMPADQKLEVEARVRELFRGYAGEDGRVKYVREAAITRGVKRA
jgi:SAM-dependent methyltransferase